MHCTISNLKFTYIQAVVVFTSITVIVRDCLDPEVDTGQTPVGISDEHWDHQKIKLKNILQGTLQ